MLQGVWKPPEPKNVPIARNKATETHVRKFSKFFISDLNCWKNIQKFQENMLQLIWSRVYIWMRMTHVDERRGRMCGTFVHFSAFAEAANRPYINVSYANSLWYTDSWRTAFGCSPNIHHTAECCLPRLGNMSTLNNGFVFACHIRVPFVFRCKPGLIETSHPWNRRKTANIVRTATK